ncbi:cytochrome P450 [Ephemerocybe angulata]|uniref:Cytochrome P450 n=1 Tax=Ephemerocybe angulata TaxID=980116 RepID=A0A8H6HR62_9AGAR|nr:cytochrome P450 [Tulosesus angulatus]
MLQSNSLQALATFTLAWVTWRVLRRFFRPDPLADVPGLKPPSWIAGSLAEIFHSDAWDFHDSMSEKYGGVFKCQGFFGAPVLYVHDPTALRYIATKDQSLFEGTDDMILAQKIVFGPGLLSTIGSVHRKQRKVMNPVFSTTQVRALRPVSYDVAHELSESLSRQISQGMSTFDMLDWMERVVLETTARGILGSTFDALNETLNPPYLVSLKNFIRVMTFSEFIFPRLLILPYICNIGPAWLRRWLVDVLPWKNLHVLRDMVDTMHNTSLELLRSRQGGVDGHKARVSDDGGRPDILTVLLKANLAASEEDKMSESELLGQITTITFGALSTTASALSRLLWVLCENPDVQEKIRQEVSDALKGGRDIEYDALISLPLLDAVVKETFRVYTPLPLIVKQSTTDTVIPLSKPYLSADGSTFSEIPIAPKTYIVVALSACNRDSAIWGDDAREWKPERWLKPLPDTVTNAKIPGVYSNQMSFYGGPKACIGYKFAELEIKTIMSLLLSKFRFSFGQKQIIWKMNGINQPMVAADDELDDFGLPRLQMPLHVSLVND